MEKKGEERKGFRSSFGVLVALAGSAVGLGNMWRFPYLMGTDGGAAFIIIYLLSIIFVCLPIMMAESLVGRRGRSNPASAFMNLDGGNRKWKVVGAFMVIGPFLIISFYNVVGGWTLDYLYRSFELSFSGNMSEEQCGALFDETMTSTWRPLFFMTLFIVLSAMIIRAGVQKGIERCSKVMMPVLFGIMVFMAIYSATLQGAGAGFEFMFKPDFSSVTGKTVLDAMGQSFFSLSMGCGTILIYSSYMSRKEDLAKMSILTAISDTGFAIISGIAMIPAVFAFGFSPSEGPGLAFVILPAIFSSMSFGGIVAIGFFISLFLAAITSSISMVEVVASCIREEFHISRRKSVTITTLCLLVSGTLCSLSCGPMSGFKVFGMNIFDLFNFTSSNFLMTLGGLTMVLFVGWRMKKEDVFDEYSGGGIHNHPALFKMLYFLTRYVAPVAIIVVMIVGLCGSR